MIKSDNILTGLTSQKIILMFIVIVVLVFEADNSRLVDTDPEREKVWRIMINLLGILTMCITAYLINLRLTR